MGCLKLDIPSRKISVLNVVHRTDLKQVEKSVSCIAFGARFYDPSIGRFTGVDPISDKFPHVSTFNYAENSPIANIDLHGLQKFFAADGKFVTKRNNDMSIRILPSKPGLNYSGMSTDILRNISTPAQTASEKNIKVTLWNWAKTYKEKGKRYNSFSEGGNREYAMSLFFNELTDEDGSTFSSFVQGNTVKGRYGKNSVSLASDKSPIEGWTRGETIHTHPFGNPTDFSTGMGGFLGGDTEFAVNNGVKLHLAVPCSNEIGVFDPNKFSEKLDAGTRFELAKKLGTTIWEAPKDEKP